jgi:hypothetical protein
MLDTVSVVWSSELEGLVADELALRQPTRWATCGY